MAYSKKPQLEVNICGIHAVWFSSTGKRYDSSSRATLSLVQSLSRNGHFFGTFPHSLFFLFFLSLDSPSLCVERKKWGGGSGISACHYQVSVRQSTGDWVFCYLSGLFSCQLGCQVTPVFALYWMKVCPATHNRCSTVTHPSVAGACRYKSLHHLHRVHISCSSSPTVSLPHKQSTPKALRVLMRQGRWTR